jgi:CheY-like chemotaxis protein
MFPLSRPLAGAGARRSYGKPIAILNLMNRAKALSGKHILLVDDDQGVRNAVRLMLSKDAHRIVEANNGAEAWMLFRRAQFDLVLTDCEMPFVKGDELASKIRELVPEQPILMITAYARKRSPKNPVDAVIYKPFDATSLREAMTRLLAQPGENAASLETTDGRHLAEDLFADHGGSGTEVISR